MDSTLALTGLDLKLRRVAARLQVKDMAEQMGISPSRVSRIEADPKVTVKMERRYMDALERCGTSRTSDPSARERIAS